MSKPSQLVFVTGASGFVASHIIHELTEQGHRVRASARKGKLEPLRALYKSVPTVEIVEIADIAHGQLEDVLKDVDAVIHTASPLPGRADVDTMLRSAVEGSVNVLRQAHKVGVKKFVVTGSTASVTGDPATVGVSFRAEHWNPVTRENATPDNISATYAAAKKYAELAVWEWAEANPDVSVTTINPPYIYGPFAPRHLPIAPGDFNALSTNLMIYTLFSPTGTSTFPPRAGYADVRDVARVHVAALNLDLPLPTPTPTTRTVQGRKRILFASPDGLDFTKVFSSITKARPELQNRLTRVPIPKYPFDRYDIDFGRVEEVTGLKKEDFHSTEQTFVDLTNDLLDMERSWKEDGFVMPEQIPAMSL